MANSALVPVPLAHTWRIESTNHCLIEFNLAVGYCFICLCLCRCVSATVNQTNRAPLSRHLTQLRHRAPNHKTQLKPRLDTRTVQHMPCHALCWFGLFFNVSLRHLSCGQTVAVNLISTLIKIDYHFSAQVIKLCTEYDNICPRADEANSDVVRLSLGRLEEDTILA